MVRLMQLDQIKLRFQNKILDGTDVPVQGQKPEAQDFHVLVGLHPWPRHFNSD